LARFREQQREPDHKTDCEAEFRSEALLGEALLDSIARFFCWNKIKEIEINWLQNRRRFFFEPNQ